MFSAVWNGKCREGRGSTLSNSISVFPRSKSKASHVYLEVYGGYGDLVGSNIFLKIFLFLDFNRRAVCRQSCAVRKRSDWPGGKKKIEKYYGVKT